MKDYKLRGTYQRAIRAPNIIELYTPPGLNLFNMSTDPCGKSAAQPVPTATLEQCLRSGITAAQYGTTGLISPTGQYQFRQGGNPNLKPETANTWTLGLVATAVAEPERDGRLLEHQAHRRDRRRAPAADPPELPASGSYSATRSIAIPGVRSGAVGFIGGITTNTGKVDTDGVDMTLNWNQPIQDWGSVGVSLVGT